MSANLARLDAARAKAAEVIAAIGEPDDGRPKLRIAVTDSETNTRLATCFVSYDTPHLRLVEGER